MNAVTDEFLFIELLADDLLYHGNTTIIDVTSYASGIC